MAYKTDRLHGFYCIKTNRNDTIIVPVEINVADNLGLYSNVDTLEFTTDGYVRSMDEAITVPIYVTNNGNDPVIISVSKLAKVEENYRASQNLFFRIFLNSSKCHVTMTVFLLMNSPLFDKERFSLLKICCRKSIYLRRHRSLNDNNIDTMTATIISSSYPYR